MSNVISDFIAAMASAGIYPVEPIAEKLAAGVPFRFRAEGDRPGKRNGWACLHIDGMPAGVFRHYRLGVRVVWRAPVDSLALSAPTRQALLREARACAKQRIAESRAKQENARDLAQDLWHRASEADPAHDYLVRKGIPAIGIRQLENALLVPMMDADCRLWNVQRIYPDGRKLFLRGGRTAGLFWFYGAHLNNAVQLSHALVIGEGFATMAAIHAATGCGVVAALSAHNLENVACTVHQHLPGRSLIIAADDDGHLAQNIGLLAAQRAARAVGGLLATPLSGAADCCRNGQGADFADLSADQICIRLSEARRCSHE